MTDIRYIPFAEVKNVFGIIVVMNVSVGILMNSWVSFLGFI